MQQCSSSSCKHAENEKVPVIASGLECKSKSKLAVESCSASFADLLQELGLAHDREIAKLRLEIAWLAEGHTPHVISPIIAEHACSEIVIEKEPAKPLSDIFAGRSRTSCSIMQEGLEDAVAKESDIQLDFCIDNRIPIESRLAISSCANGTSMSHQSVRLSSSSLVDQQRGDDPLAVIRIASGSIISSLGHHLLDQRKSAQEPQKEVVQAPDPEPPPPPIPSRAYLCKSASNLSLSGIKTKPMERWQHLINIAKSGPDYVKLDRGWQDITKGYSGEKSASGRLCSSNVGELIAGVLAHSGSEAVDAMGHEDSSVWLRASHSFDVGGNLVGWRPGKDSWFQWSMRIVRRLKFYSVLHPNSWLKVLWDLLGMALLMHDFVLIPLQVFDNGTGGLGDGYIDFWSQLDKVSLVFWTCDLIVNFVTGYYTDEGFVQFMHWMIFKHYFKTWFPMDFGIVAVDWTGFLLNFDSEVGYLRLGKVISRFLRILRLLRFMKMSEKFNEVLEMINSEYILTLVGVMKLLVGIIMVNHYIACMWYYLSTMEVEKTWSTDYLRQNEHMGYAYLTSMHWSLTQFTPASMEVHPTNTYERIYSVVVIVGAMVTFSSFVSSITGAMTHLRTINAKKAEQDAAFRQYFSTNKISQELARQVWHFRRHNVTVNKLRMKESDLPALKFLPSRLREMVRFEVFFPILSPHPLFALYYDLCPDAVTRICNQAMSESQLLAGEELKDITYPIDRMVFVCGGLLKYFFVESQFQEAEAKPLRRFLSHRMTRAGRKASAHSRTSCSFAPVMTQSGFVKLVRGQWAMELSLWSNSGRIVGPFTGGETGAELVLLHASKFRSVVLKHSGGDGLHLIAEYARAFVKRFNEACFESTFHNILFNDAELLCEILDSSTSQLLDGRDSRISRDSLNSVKSLTFKGSLVLKGLHSLGRASSVRSSMSDGKRISLRSSVSSTK